MFQTGKDEWKQRRVFDQRHEPASKLLDKWVSSDGGWSHPASTAALLQPKIPELPMIFHIWDCGRLQPAAAASSGRASPTLCPTLGLVFRQLVTAILHPKCSKKWGCSEVRAHFLFHLSACEIDFSHVGFKVEGRIFKSTFLPLQVQEKKPWWGQTDRQEHVSLCQVVLLFVKR